MEYYDKNKGTGRMPKRVIKKTSEMNEAGKLGIKKYKQVVVDLQLKYRVSRKQDKLITKLIVDAKQKIANIYYKLVTDNK